MGTREKLFRQKLADQIEGLLTKSEKVFTTEKLSKEWLDSMLQETQEVTSALTIYQFLHELPEDENLQIEFLELAEKEAEPDKETEVSSYGDEIMKEIDEFETTEALDVKPIDEDKTVVAEESEEEPIETEIILEEEEISIHEEEEITEIIIDTDEQDSKKEKNKPAEINDLNANQDASIADKLRKKSITKLAESIALNERFLYSNELFNGNMEAFKRALTELDHIASLEDARRYIDMQLKPDNDWKMESNIVKGFISLVERRFN